MISLPDVTDPCELVDWLEASLLVDDQEQPYISDAEIYDVFEEANLEAETFFHSIAVERRRRETVLGAKYAVVRDGQGFGLKADTPANARLIYEFLLFTSLNQAYASLRFQGGTAGVPAELFEFLTLATIQKYIGGSAIRLGAARKPPVPALFPAAVKYLSEVVAEEFLYGQLENQLSGDDGLDVVAWLPFADKQPSQLVILAQCAIGTDWKKKRSELDLEVWREHIHWHTGPLKAFAVPFCHASGTTWRETAVRGGIIFDRLRIMAGLDFDTISKSTLSSIQKWRNGRVKQVQKLKL